MAGLDDLAAYLAVGDKQKAAIAASDPYAGFGNIGNQVTQAAIQANGYPLKDRIILGVLGGLGSGIAGGLSDSYNARAQTAYGDSVANILGGGEVERPSILSPTIFADAQQQAGLFKARLAIAQAEQGAKLANDIALENRKLGNDTTLALRRELIANPEKAPTLLKLMGLSDNAVMGGTAPISTPSEGDAEALPGPTKPNVDPVTRYNELLAATGDKSVANKILETEIGERAKKKDEIDKYISEAQAGVDSSKQASNDLEVALSGAGQTGSTVPGEETLRSLKIGIQDFLGNDSAANRNAARADLDSQGLVLAGQIKKLFGGATAASELAQYLKAVPGTSKTPEQNLALKQRMDRATAIAQQKIEFLNTAKEQGYSLADANKLYSKIDAYVPIFKGGEINPERLQLDFTEIPLATLDEAIKKKPTVTDNTAMQTQVPAVASAPIATPQAQPSVFGTAKDIGMGVLNAGAQFGESAFLGLPKYAVAAGKTIYDEGKDLVGLGEGKTIGENFSGNVADIKDKLDTTNKEYPVTGTAAGLSGAFLSPINKIGAVKSIFNMGGLAGVGARAALAGGQAAINNIGENAKKQDDEITNTALLSAGLDTVVKGLGSLAPAAKATFMRLTGVTAQNYKKAAESLKKADVTKAKEQFSNALNIIKQEHGVGYKDLVGSDENVLSGLAQKTIDSIKSRNTEIDSIINEADKALAKAGVINVKVVPNQLRKATVAGKGITSDEINQEGQNLLQRFSSYFSSGAKLKDLQEAKKVLNSLRDPAAKSSYTDAVNAVGDDFRTSIEKTITSLVTQKKLPPEMLGRIKKLNLEERDLMRLRDAYISKLPSAMAQDLLGSAQKSLFSTGTSGAVGAGNLGGALGGDASKFGAMAAAFAAYSNRIARPVSKAIADEDIAKFMASPEFRSLSNQVLDNSSTPEQALDFSAPQLAPSSEATKSIFSIIGNQKKNDSVSNGLLGATKMDSTPPNLKGPTVSEAPIKEEFAAKVNKISDDLGIDPSHLLQAISFETGGTFSSKVKNGAGSGATGLIQFMPSTAKSLTGAKTEAAAIKHLESLSEVDQLDYVKEYLKPYAKKIKTFDDLYMAIFKPSAIGKPDDYPLFTEGSRAYAQNAGLDLDGDGTITKAEAAARAKRDSGLVEA